MSVGSLLGLAVRFSGDHDHEPKPARACAHRSEMTPSELLRAATGFAGLRLPPPGAAWLQGLAAAAAPALEAAEQQQQGQEEGEKEKEEKQESGPGSAVGSRKVAAGGLSADEASRLRLALAELELLLPGGGGGDTQQQQQQQEAAAALVRATA